VPALSAAEIKALARILDELDYYQLLEVERGVQRSAVQRAYHVVSRRFHPDANRGHEPDVRNALEAIARRLAEAYSVLRDARRRRAYDAQLADGSGSPRMQLAEAEARAGQQALAETKGRTPNGRRFFALACAEIDRGAFDEAARHIQMALTFEPDNAYFRRRFDEVRAHRR
jgi:DnaJ-class molecular chaperone